MSDYDKAMTSIRAWKDGAASRAMNPAFTDHPDEELRLIYENSYTAGQQAAREWSKTQEERFGVKFSIIRAASGEASSAPSSPPK